MSKRTIIARFEIEDNDFIEQKLFESLQCNPLKDFKVLPDTQELYENDKVFRKMITEKSKLQHSIDDYIYNKINN